MKVASFLAFVAITSATFRISSVVPRPVESHQFDFWIGDWKIHERILRQDGTWLEREAKTSVAPALDSCALVEHWEGEVEFFWEGMEKPERMKGLSVRAFDPATSQWYIHLDGQPQATF